MQSELKSLSKIFAEVILRIPDYQRGYSWQLKHLKDFWNDLEQLPLGKNHYTGVLTLEPVDKSNYERWEDDLWIIKSKLYQPLYVVDGQQRLTTAIVLMQSILDSIEEGMTLNYTSKSEIKKKYIFESKDGGISRSYIFGYEKDNPSYEFLKKNIYGEQSELHSGSESTIYTFNLQNAKNFFDEGIKKLTPQQIEELYTKVTQHLHFNIFYIEPELDVFVTFETMNNRGKPLSHLELLKNRLIYLSTRFEEEDPIEQNRLRRKINESWKSIYHYLGRKTSKVLDDDMFLQTHFLSYFGPDLPKNKDDEDSIYEVIQYIRPDQQFKNYLLEQIFTVRRLYSKEDRLTIAELDHYAQDIKQSVEQYYYLYEPDQGPFESDEKIALQRIDRIKRRPDLRLLGLIIQKVVKESDRRISLLTIVERYAFLAQLQYTNFRNVNVFKLAIKLKAADITPEAIGRELENSCEKYIASKEFTDTLKSIGKGDGYYGWTGLRYFMFEYEQYLRVRSKSARQVLDWETFQSEKYDSDHRSIEHIYPKTATDSYWKDRFSKYSLQERNVLRNSLGNLLPVSLPKNSSLSNAFFAKKKGAVESQVGYCYGCLAEIQVSQQVDWDARRILARGLSLLSFMESRWGLSLGDDNKKTEILGLEFVPSREGADIRLIKETYLTAIPDNSPASIVKRK